MTNVFDNERKLDNMVKDLKMDSEFQSKKIFY